jgi:Contractile injection system tube protein
MERAELRELDAEFANAINRDKWVKVQFNPETLKVTFANQIAQGSGAGDQRGSPARQFVGAGTTKLALQLWFDVTAYATGTAPANDVRELTQRVAYFITPKPITAKGGGGGGAAGGGGRQQQPQFAPPAVRFIWGSFQFDGIMEQLEEMLEFWSPDGRPLRASVSLGLSQQKITFAFNPDKARGASAGPAAGATPGTRPLAQAPAGSTLPGVAAAAGTGGSWQSIAAANGIEDPLRLTAGQLVDLSARVPRGG